MLSLFWSILFLVKRCFSNIIESGGVENVGGENEEDRRCRENDVFALQKFVMWIARDILNGRIDGKFIKLSMRGKLTNYES